MPPELLLLPGPCAKRRVETRCVSNALVGRSHRSRSVGPYPRGHRTVKAILGVPDDYYLGIVPASDTGAMEMAMWSLLGPRGVDVLAWESFGEGWVTDITKQLRLPDVRVFRADYGQLPELGQVSWDRDVVFPWNGTTSGVRVPNADWIAADREGLAICDATSAVFAMPVDIGRLDVVTYSWQKVWGVKPSTRAHHSPRAVERLKRMKRLADA